MIRATSSTQLTIADFDWPFDTALDKHNRWVTLSECIPWDALAESYYQGFTANRGRPMKEARLVIGAVIIKHKLCLSDVETVQQIQENPYLQFFVGLPSYQTTEPFAASLFVEIRKRMGDAVFEGFHRAIIAAHEGQKPVTPEPPAPPATSTASASVESALASCQAPSSITSPEDTAPPAAPESSTTATDTPTHQGQLIVDATVLEQAIRFPTDLSLLNEAREFSEKIIDALCKNLNTDAKPRTYRRKARSAYLAVAKQKRPGTNVLRRGLKQQLQYLRRNLGHIERLLAPIPQGSPLPLPRWLLYRYWVIQHRYQQQWHMFQSNTRRCDHRIVSIYPKGHKSQPYVRPIVRGKLGKAVEFGAKLSVSLTGDSLAHVDHLSWDAFNEGQDLIAQVDAYRARYGHYPEKVLADPLFGTRHNRDTLKQRGIHFADKPLGRPKQDSEANRAQLKQAKAQRRQDYLRRIPIEGKFGQGKRAYRLNDIRAKRANTAFAWINSIFLVMNLLILARIFFAPRKRWLAALLSAVRFAWQRAGLNPAAFLRPTADFASLAS